MHDRKTLLRTFIQQRPEDPFPRYALALEHKNAGELPEAWEAFEALLGTHPDYTAGYLHAGNTLIALGRVGDARRTFEAGVAACVRRGDGHARSELEGALAALRG